MDRYSQRNREAMGRVRQYDQMGRQPQSLAATLADRVRAGVPIPQSAMVDGGVWGPGGRREDLRQLPVDNYDEQIAANRDQARGLTDALVNRNQFDDFENRYGKAYGDSSYLTKKPGGGVKLVGDARRANISANTGLNTRKGKGIGDGLSEKSRDKTREMEQRVAIKKMTPEQLANMLNSNVLSGKNEQVGQELLFKKTAMKQSQAVNSRVDLEGMLAQAQTPEERGALLSAINQRDANRENSMLKKQELDQKDTEVKSQERLVKEKLKYAAMQQLADSGDPEAKKWIREQARSGNLGAQVSAPSVGQTGPQVDWEKLITGPDGVPLPPSQAHANIQREVEAGRLTLEQAQALADQADAQPRDPNDPAFQKYGSTPLRNQLQPKRPSPWEGNEAFLDSYGTW
jgi:hypothetical protein